MSSEELFENNMKLVYHITKRYNYRDREELNQQGFIGLWKAARKYEPSYNVAFFTYAVFCIKNEINMFLRKEKKQKMLDCVNFCDLENEEYSLDSVVYEESFDDLELKNLLRGLDGQERKICLGIAYGYTFVEIGDRLGMSHQSVQEKFNRLKSKISKIEDLYNYESKSKLRINGKTDKQLIEELNIPQRIFYRWKHHNSKKLKEAIAKLEDCLNPNKEEMSI